MLSPPGLLNMYVLRIALLFLSVVAVDLCWVSASGFAQKDLDGHWDCEIESPGGAIRFGMKITSSPMRCFLVNGSEEIAVKVKIDDSTLSVDMDHYDSKITAQYSEQQLTGKWRKRRGKSEWVEMSFSARRHKKERRDPKVNVSGRWIVNFEKSDDPAVAVFEQDKSTGRATGTFQTTTGDYRFLAGGVSGNLLELSCFDGAHAFLFRAHLKDDGSLKGDFWSSNTWHETWTAQRKPDATLPDAFQQTKMTQPGFGELGFPDLIGKTRRLDDPAFQSKARLIYVFGSWCPNCHDAAGYFAELKKEYGSDLSILGLAFELTGDFGRDAKQVRRYLKRHKVDYPVLVAGTADKKKATQKLGFLDRVRSYPTTLFVDQKGTIHGIHTGFSGPATGEAYSKQKKKFKQLIEKMIKENG